MEKEGETKHSSNVKVRKRPARAEFHFPIYPLSTALDIIEKIENNGAGSLPESALAISMGMSVKGSGFQLKVLTAKQFGLLTKQGDNLVNTQLAKSILKPISAEEKINALAQTFHNIPLFKAVSEKYEGSPLPLDEALKNVLEREFKVVHDRVSSAYSMLINSAKTAKILQESQGKVYLVRKSKGIKVDDKSKTTDTGDEQQPPKKIEEIEPVTVKWNFSIDTKDLVGMKTEEIKAMMDGLKNLATILKQESSQENNEK